jgi:glycosyltransferase involved in cell wall biosynthesis
MVSTTDAMFLFVDDGSTDSTREILNELEARTRGTTLFLPKNAGKSEAVRQGLLKLATKDGLGVVGYLDADGAFSHSDITRLVANFDAKIDQLHIDALWSSRVALSGRDIQRSERRHYLGRIIATFLSFGEDNFPYDTQSGFKIFAWSSQLEECLRDPFISRWLFEVEMLARWRNVTGKDMVVWEEPLDHWHDVAGSRIDTREYLRIARELWVVKQEQRRLRNSRTHHSGQSIELVE